MTFLLLRKQVLPENFRVNKRKLQKSFDWKGYCYSLNLRLIIRSETASFCGFPVLLLRNFVTVLENAWMTEELVKD